MKKICCNLMATLMVLGLCVPAYASGISEVTMPPTETTINGIPEIEYHDPVQTRDVIARTFYNYKNNVHKEDNTFKKFAHFRQDNTHSTDKGSMNVTVSQSDKQGSEWSFSQGYGFEFKTKILGSLKADYNLNLKETRERNEAVGYTASHPVSGGKVGYFDMYYIGEKIGGEITYKQFNTANPSNFIYVTEDVNATVYDKDVLSVNAVYYEKSN